MSAISNLLARPVDNFSTTLSANITSSALTISLNSTSGLPTEGIGVIFAKDSAGAVTASSVEIVHWTGVSGSNLTLTDTGDRGLTGSASGAQAHNSGDTFEMWVVTQYYEGLRAAVAAEHNDAGTHKIASLDAIRYAADAGSTDAYAITLAPVPASYATGMRIYFKANTINTGAATVNVNSLGAKSLKILKDQDPPDGYIKAGSFIEVIYDGTNFQILKVSDTPGAGTITADTDGATITFDLAVSNVHGVTLGGNRTLALSNAQVGQKFVIRLKQDATGSRIVTWFSGISWAGGSAPTLTTTANKADTFGFLVTASGAYDGYIIGQNI